MNKTYSRINWQNEPSIATPINETNLNAMDAALDTIDNRVVTFDTSKANQSDLLQTVKTVAYNTETGVFTFTFWNGTSFTADLNIEKIPVDFSMDEHGVITMTTADGTTYTCDIASLIKLYTFNDSSEIDFTTTTDASGNKTITASIVSGSITGDKLQPNYLADCVSAKNGAETAESHASQSARDAGASALDSEAWAVGERSGQPVPSSDPTYENNAKWWALHGTGSSFYGLSDTNFTNLQDGQIAKYDSQSGMWVNTEDEGGLLPHFKITSEAGSTVTVVLPDGVTTITPTQTSSGIWQCDVPSYGVYTVHAVINGDDAVRTVTVDTVKEYVIHDEHYSYTLNVYAPTGSSIIVTDGSDETYTGTGAGSTAVIFALHQASTTYTITVTYDGLDIDTTITSSATTGGSGSKTITFGTINLTVDEDLIGETIAMTKGTDTVSKVASSTSVVFYPNATGNWTISCEYEGETYYSEPNPVVVSSLSTPVSAEISLVHIPEGTTVLPTDDIQTWLACANITNKSYTTLAEVLADAETYETLLADSNACDYMARSTSWAVNTVSAVPVMTDDTHPSGVASASSVYASGDYKAWKVFNGTNADQYDCWASVNNATYPQYLDYEFEEPVCINRVEYYTRNFNESSSPKDVDLQAYDGSSWITLGSNTSTVATQNTKVGFSVNNYQKYSKYRFNIRSKNGSTPAYVCIGELSYFEPDITTNQDAMALIGKYDYCSNALLSNATWASAIANSDYISAILPVNVPTMTSNTAPSGQCEGGPNLNGSYPAWKAFDGNDTTQSSLQSANKVAYIQYDFPTEQNIRAFSFLIKSGSSQGVSLEISYSDDNSTFTPCGTYDYTSYINQVKTYVLDNNYGAHRYWRITRTLSTTAWSDVAYTVQFYGRASKEVFVPLIPTMTSDTTPSGVCSASSVTSGGYDAWRAFDGNDSTHGWCPNISTSSLIGTWIKYEFPNPVKVDRIRALQKDSASTNTTYKLEASNDDIDWTTISDSLTMTKNSVVTFSDVTTSTKYRYYRITMLTNTVTGTITGFKFQFYEKGVQTNIIHSAPNDYIYMLEDGVPTPICRTNEDGDGIFDFSELEEGVYTFGSTVAKNPNDLSEDFKKRIRITKTPYGGTTERYLLPDTIDTLYWYGYEDNLEDMTSANGWSRSTYTFSAPTHNTTDVDCNANGTQVISGIGSKNKIASLTKTYAIAQGVTVVNSSYGNTKTEPSKAVDASTATSQVLYDTNTSKFYQGNLEISNNYLTACSIANRRCKVSALWYTRGSNDIPTFISAANDTLYIMDGSNKIYIANTNGEGKSYEPLLEAGTYTIYSSVAKDPNNLSNPYSKTVTVDESTQTIAVMPENTLYWWGYNGGIEDAISANGWTASASYGINWVLISPTWNMNNVSHTSSSNTAHVSGVVTKTKYNLSNYNSIKLLADSSAQGIYLRTFSTSNDFINGGDINVGLVIATDVQHTEDISSLTAESYIGVQLGRQTGVGALKYLFLE